MVTLLAKLFIRDHENVTDSGVRQAYGMLCGIVGIFFNLILFTTKALAGFFSHSIAITADAFNNLSDAASSIIRWQASKWRDRSRTLTIPSDTDGSNISPGC